MAYRQQQMQSASDAYVGMPSAFDACEMPPTRDARSYQGFNDRDKLLPGPYDVDMEKLNNDDEDSDRYFSDEDEEEEAHGCSGPGKVGTVCALVAASLAAVLLAHSVLGGGREAQLPVMTPPKMVVQQPPPFVPQTPAPLLRATFQTTAQTVVYMPPATTTRNPLLPAEDIHDHNVCDSNEELYATLCYQKCAALTKGSHPVRTSSWTCCEREPCTLGNTVGAVGTTFLCRGYDVDGSGNCPHEPGACLTNEELLLGVCYEKCSILTGGEFSYRVGPATCCKSESMLGCFDVRKDKTRSEYNTGGGVGDHDQATPNWSHPPLMNLTESADTASTSYVPPTAPPGQGGHAPSDTACQADEELYAGLCYKKCALLTEGEYSIRTSSWTCCASHPCGLSNQKGSIGKALLCNGFDVGGSGAVKLTSHFSCPHKPEACGPDEEDLLGVCYTKCSLLTGGQFPNRVAAATCCKEKGIRACMDFRKVATDPGFDVGIVA